MDELDYGTLAATLRRFRTDGIDRPPQRIALLHNVTINPLIPCLEYVCYTGGIEPQVQLGNFDTVIQDVLDPNSTLYAFKPDVIIICLKLEALSETLTANFASLADEQVQTEVDRILTHFATILDTLRQRTATTILVHNFETVAYPALGIVDYQRLNAQLGTIRNLNVELARLIANHPGTYIVDVDLLQTRVGHTHYFDQRYWHIGRAPYTPAACRAITTEYGHFLRALAGKTRKCLVLDCDNTLWGGIVGEDGPAGIRISNTFPGSAYRAFQQAILDLHQRGVMIALCSKNNDRDVFDVLDNHPDMLLRREHLVAWRINWNDKATNLREIADELNVGLDSLVFVDDNPAEIDWVRRALTMVTCVQLPDDPTRYADLLRAGGWFDTLTLSDEDRQRSRMYQAERQRQAARAGFAGASVADYLRYLDMRVTIALADEDTIPRISQLTQKTNQFNLTTRRYSESEIRSLAADPNSAVAGLRLSDRFGDNGLVGVLILRFTDNSADIDTLLLSCRVIGRGAEDVLLATAAQLASHHGCSKLTAEYRPTAKNNQVANFYPTHGLTQIGPADDATRYELSLTASNMTPPDHFAQMQLPTGSAHLDQPITA